MTVRPLAARFRRGLAWAAAAAALGLVALAWQDPGLTVDLANAIRSCF